MPPNTTSFDRPKGRDLHYLRRTAEFLKPYKGRVAAAVVALAPNGMRSDVLRPSFIDLRLCCFLPLLS